MHVTPRPTQPSVPPTSSTPAPTRARPDPTPASVARDAAGSVAALSDARRGASVPPLDRAARALVAAYREGGRHSVRTTLRDQPELLRAIAGATAGAASETLVRELERVDDTLVDGLRADGILDVARDTITHQTRAEVRRAALTRARAQRRALDDIAADPDALANLRTARPGSPEARLAGLLGVRGEAGDARRLEDRLDAARSGLGRFIERVEHGTWQLGQLPSASAAAMRRLGLAPRPGSLAAEVLGETRTDVQQAVGHLVHAAEAAHLSVDVAHTLHATGVARLAAGAGLGVSLAGVAAALVAHEAAAAANDEFVATAHALGL